MAFQDPIILSLFPECTGLRDVDAQDMVSSRRSRERGVQDGRETAYFWRLEITLQPHAIGQGRPAVTRVCNPSSGHTGVFTDGTVMGSS